MGTCSNTDRTSEKKTNDIINQQLRAADKSSPYNSKTHTIFTWGVKGCGISTIFKQVKHVYNGEFSDNERIEYIPCIYKQCVDQMKLIIKSLHEKQPNQYDNENGKYTLSKQGLEAKKCFVINSKCKLLILHNYIRQIEKNIQNIVPLEIYQLIDAYSNSYTSHCYFNNRCLFDFLNEWNIKQSLNDKIVESIKCLWNEPLIKQIYLANVGFNIYHSSSYFWNKIDSIYQPNYIPSTNDILLVHQKYLDVRELRFSSNNSNVTIINATGQYNEKNKWIDSFDFVDALLFVVSLDSYNLLYWEDSYVVDVMEEQLWQWENLVNRIQFEHSEKILWLNKSDLFKEKLKSISIKQCPSFDDYFGDPHSFDECIQFIREIFKSKYQPGRWRNNTEIYCHVTCAIDQENIKKYIQNLLSITYYHKHPRMRRWS